MSKLPIEEQKIRKEIKKLRKKGVALKDVCLRLHLSIGRVKRILNGIPKNCQDIDRKKKLGKDLKRLFRSNKSQDQIFKELHTSSYTAKQIVPGLDWAERNVKMQEKELDRDKIVEEYLTGIPSVTSLAKKYGTALSTISYILKERGVTIQHPISNMEGGLAIYAEIQHLSNMGWETKRIAEFLGISIKAVRRRLHKLKNRKKEKYLKRRIPMPIETYVSILGMLAEERNGAEIGKEVGLTRSYINAIKKGRWVHPGYKGTV